jgi:hypothetical protein
LPGCVSGVIECGAVGRTLCTLVVLESLKAGKSGAACDQLMAEAGLVLVEVVVLVDLLVVVLVPVWEV